MKFIYWLLVALMRSEGITIENDIAIIEPDTKLALGD